MNGVGTSIASSKIPKAAFFRNRAGTLSKPEPLQQPIQRQLPTPTQSPLPRQSPSHNYDLDRALPPPPQPDTFGRSRPTPPADFELELDEDEPMPTRDDRFTPMPARSTRRQRTGRGDKLGREALESPPPTAREDEFGSGTSGSGASGSGLSLGLSGLESSTSTAATSAVAGGSGGAAAAMVPPAVSRTMGNDEMLFALLAGQAAVDCSQLPIAGWEEVEGWKKELEVLSSRLEALQARHQREVKILAAARTLQKLNSSHKRMSKATMESLEQSEKRVGDAEREVLVLRDREAALRRRLMEHWSGVMAWEVRRLERQAADARHERELQEVAIRGQLEAERGTAVSREEAEATQRREQELLERVREIEAERDQHAERARTVECELDQHADRASSMDDRLRELEAERDRQAERARAAETELDQHTSRASSLEERLRELEAERDRHSERARTAESELDKHVTRARSLETERDQFTTQTRGLESERDQHASTIRDLEDERDARGRKIEELEERIHEFGLRERTLQDNAKAAEAAINTVNEEREEWARERSEIIAEREELIVERDGLLGERDSLNRERDDIYHKHGALVAESAQASRARDKLTAERDAWVKERETLVAERDGHATERSRLAVFEDKATSHSKALDRVCEDLAQLLGHKVADYELPAAVDEIRALQDKKEREIAGLKDELREVTHGFEAEIGRIKTDRDALRSKADEAGPSARAMQVEMTELVRKIRSQNDTIAELQRQVDSKPQSQQPRSNDEAAAINATLAKVWKLLPAPDARAESGLTARVISPGVSPNSPVDFAALQKAYFHPPEMEYTGVNDLASRIRSVVDDGRIMAERMARMEVEKERHKANARRAAKLVEDSRHSLETYQRQVDILEDRLAQANNQDISGQVASLRSQLDEAQEEISRLCNELVKMQSSNSNSNSKPSAAIQNQLASLQRELEQSLKANRKLGDEIASRSDAVARLNEVNDQLSARTLAMADEAEGDKRALSTRHAEELDMERAKFLEQRVQMLDEMNSLQAEVGELRAKLRR